MLNALRKTTAKWLLGSKPLTVLTFHQVLAEKDPMRPQAVTASEFNNLLGTLKRHFQILPLGLALDRLKSKELKEATVVITFDDGYLDNLTVALPILKQHGLSATLFSTSAYLDGGLMWNDQIIESLRDHPDSTIDLRWLDMGVQPLSGIAQRAQLAYQIIPKIKHLPACQRQSAIAHFGSPAGPQLMLNAQQLRLLHQQGIEIAGHSHSHPVLATLTPEQQQFEIKRNKQVIEQILDQPLNGFAYPNGKPKQDYDLYSIEAVKAAGYQWAVTTERGCCSADSDPYQLPRFSPWSHDGWRLFKQLIQNRWYRSTTLAQPIN